MTFTRRQFAAFLGVAPAGLFGEHAKPLCKSGRILERRIYDRAGVVPPRSVLRRSGIERFARREGKRHVEFRIQFDSLGERTRAWDRFNSDPEWCALRAGGDVRLTKIMFASGA